MAASVVIVLGAACAFYCYALVRFGREISLLRSQRNRSVIVPFRSAPEFRRGAARDSSTKMTVLPISGDVDRDVA